MVTVEQLYKALRAHGASEIQAAGIVGNAVSETGPSTSDLSPNSELNPGFYEPACMGLWCWTTPYYHPPQPTGNVEVDVNNQIDYLISTGGFAHATGADARAAGENFALNYERCAECFAGGQQFVNRGNQAAAVAELAAANHWDAPPPPPPPPADPHHYLKFDDTVRHWEDAKKHKHFGSERDIVKEYDQKRKHPKLHFLRLRTLRSDLSYLSGRLEEMSRHGEKMDEFNRAWRLTEMAKRAKGERLV